MGIMESEEHEPKKGKVWLLRKSEFLRILENKLSLKKNGNPWMNSGVFCSMSLRCSWRESPQNSGCSSAKCLKRLPRQAKWSSKSS